MKYLNNYKIFENIQKAEKILKGYDIDNKTLKNLYHFYDILKKKNLHNYAGFITELLIKDVLEDNQELYMISYNLPINYDDVNDCILIKLLKVVKDRKIDTSKLDFDTLDDFNEYIKIESGRSKLIDICPSFLRKDLKELLKSNDPDKKFKLLNIINSNYLDIKKEKLIKKGSRYKDIDSWLDYILIVISGDEFDSEDVEEIKNSNSEVIYEDEEYFIYRPLDYKTNMIIKYKHWCTTHKDYFNKYKTLYFVIYLNKNDIKKSYCSYTVRNDFEVYSYTNNNILRKLLGDKIDDNKLLEIGRKWTLNKVKSQSDESPKNSQKSHHPI